MAEFEVDESALADLADAAEAPPEYCACGMELQDNSGECGRCRAAVWEEPAFRSRVGESGDGSDIGDLDGDLKRR